MKDKIIMLIIGILIGAVITAGCFLIFSKNNSSSTQGGGQMGTPPDANGMSFNQTGGPNGGGQAPDKAGTTNSTTTDNTNSL